MDLEDGESERLDRGEGSESDGTSSDIDQGTDDSDYASDGSYDIAEDIGIFSSEGQARMESKYFTLYLPSDGGWNYRILDKTGIQIYYEPARQSGNGGNLVTIRAYEWGDNSYEDFPSYAVAGLSEHKKYIAIFPTDVQYGPDQEEGYRRMFQHVRRISTDEEHAAENPFFCNP